MREILEDSYQESCMWNVIMKPVWKGGLKVCRTLCGKLCGKVSRKLSGKVL